MSWLALDTASARMSVAAGEGQLDATELHVDGPRQHARTVLPLIDQVLAARGERLAGLDGVIVADGPGSFTGLRVGAAVVKALHDALGLPVWTAPSLLGVARLRSDAGQVLVTSDALRGDVYAAVYRFTDGAVECLVAPRVIAREAAASLAPGAVALHEQPADAARLLALRDLDGGLVRVEDLGSWTPEYGRPAEAQARWEHQHGRPLTRTPGLAG